MTGDNLLAIDVGTQSVRAIVFTPKGKLIARSKVEIVPYVSPKPGWAEQDPEIYWEAMCKACNTLWREQGIDPMSIAGAALTAQRSTVVIVDKEGKPLRPAIIWIDQRRTEGFKRIGGLWGLIFSVAGLQDTVGTFQGEAEANWIKQYEPETWAKVHKYLLLSGYLTYRLTGSYSDSVACQVGYIPFDFKKKTWANASDWKWQAIAADRSMMPDLVSPGEVIGQLTRQASEDLGLPDGVKLIAAAGDKACEVLGSGGIAPHIGCISYGTTATINTTNKKYVEVVTLVPPYPSADPDAYCLEVQVYRGFWLISWFKREFGYREETLAAEKGVVPEQLFDELVRDIPPGSMGLLLQPTWSPGVRVPGPEAKGAVIGWGDVHTRGHFYRAILEGLAYSMREGAERTEKRSGVKITELRVAGGGSQSDMALQITADIFGLPASRPSTYEASALGAAIDLAVGLGYHNDFSEAVNEMTGISETFEPIQANHHLYESLYQEVYLQMYGRLRPLYERIRRITGYPARYVVKK